MNRESPESSSLPSNPWEQPQSLATESGALYQPGTPDKVVKAAEAED